MAVTKLSLKQEQEKNLAPIDRWGLVGKDYNAIVEKVNEIIDNLGADDVDFTELTATVEQLGTDLTAAQASIAALPAELMLEITQDTTSTTSGLLVVGKMYVIATLLSDDDFANVGYVEEGTPFEATGTTPTKWTNSTIVVNVAESAPVISTIKNDIGVITWSREAVGVYYGTKLFAFQESTGLFIHQKVIIPAHNTAARVKVSRLNDDQIVVESFSDSAGTHADGILDATPIHLSTYPLIA